MPSKSDKPANDQTSTARRRKSVAKKAPVKLEEQLAQDSAPAAPSRDIAGTNHRSRSHSIFSGDWNVRYKDVTAFLRQLIMMLEAGTPILRSLKTLSHRGERAAIRDMVADITDYVENGNALWQAFERHPRHFDPVFVNLIKASEASGTLVPVLQRLVLYRERREVMRKRILQAMMYPVFLVVMCFALVVLLSTILMPQIATFFEKMDKALPRYTEIFMATTRFIAAWWWLGALIIVGLIVLYQVWVRFSPRNRLIADRIKLYIPLVGSISQKRSIVEMTRSLSLLLRSGLSMLVTLELTRNVIPNRAIAQVLTKVQDSVERGEGIEAPLRANDRLVPPLVTDMLVTGEETGSLDTVAGQISDTYEEEMNIEIAALGEAMTPVLTVFIGAIVLMLMLTVFVPLITMINEIGESGL